MMEEAIQLVLDRRDPNRHDLIRRLILGDIFDVPVFEVVDDQEFNLNNIEDQFIKPFFRFNREDIQELTRVLHIPNNIRTRTGHFVATGVEALCIFLRRLVYPNRLRDLENFFKRSPAALSEICTFIADHITQNFQHLLLDIGNHQFLNRERLEIYAQAVTNREGAVLNCWAFIDGTAMAICRPTDIQEEYSALL